MKQDEKRTVGALRRAAEAVPVPPSLKPDAMMERLGAESPVAPRRPRHRRWLAAAAVLLVAVAGLGAAWGASLLGSAPHEAVRSAPPVFGEATAVRTASSYDEVAACFAAYQDRIASERGGADEGFFGLFGDGTAKDAGDVVEDLAVAGGDTGASSASAAAASGDFSTTNLRTAGVDEADVVKTDGSCLYVLTDDGSRIAIVRADGGSLESVGSIEVPAGRSIVEFYLDGGRLFVLTTTAWYEADIEEVGTQVVTFDVSDPSQPAEVGSVTQSGAYRTSRFTDGYLYVFSFLSFYEAPCDGDPAAAAPLVDGRPLGWDDIFLPADGEANGYLVVTAVPADDPTGVTVQKGLLHCSGELYVGSEAIYIYEDNYRGKNSATDIVRLTYEEGKVSAAGQCTVRGTVNDSFSIDEHEGYLRVVTTIYGEAGQTTNALFVLDGAMNEVGSIVGLAEGETVQSARFMGDVGYFVTFRQVDPLFTVELSDPAAPRIVGELKIPGFSAYLHPYGEGRLLGIGWDATDGGTGSAKLTMFDTSDPANVTEAGTLVLEGIWDIEALYDYRAVLVEPDRNLIGFSARGLEATEDPGDGGESAYYSDVERYYLFGYDDETGFAENLRVPVTNDPGAPVRGLRIADVLYVATDGSIESFGLQDGEPIAALEL